MTLAFTNLLVWVPLILVFLLSDSGIMPLWLAVIWLINVIPGMLLSFQRDNWLSGLIPGNTLGRYLGHRLAIKSGFYLAAFFTLGYLLDSFGEKKLTGFAFVFILALVMSLIDFIIFTYMQEPAKKDTKTVNEKPLEIKFGIFDFIGELRKKKLDKFFLFISFINVSVGISGPLYAVYMLQERNFTYISFTIIISVEFLARVVSAPFWGRFADKAGNIRVLAIISRIVPAIPVCWLFSTNIGYLVFIQVLSGICWGAFDLSTQSYLYKVAPQPKKLRYIVYTRSLTLFSVAVGGILGAFLAENIFLTFGSRLLSVFMISGFFRAVVVMFLMPKLIDMAVTYGKPKEPRINLTLTGDKAISKRGLFYRPRGPVSALAYPQGITMPGSLMYCVNPATENRPAEARPAKRKPAARAETASKADKSIWPVTKRMKNEIILPEIKPVRRPRYGDVKNQFSYSAKAPAPAGLPMSAGKTGSPGGLFYDGAGWSRYMKETLQNIVRESREARAAGRLKPVFTGNGYTWKSPRKLPEIYEYSHKHYLARVQDIKFKSAEVRSI